MSTLELNGKDFATQTSSAEPVLASTVTGGAGLSGSTSLGTVTVGNLSHADIVYPDGHIIKHTLDKQTNSGSDYNVAGTTATVPMAYQTITCAIGNTIYVTWNFLLMAYLGSGSGNRVRKAFSNLYQSTSSVAQDATGSFGTKLAATIGGRVMQVAESYGNDSYAPTSLSGFFVATATTHYVGVTIFSDDAEVTARIRFNTGGDAIIMNVQEIQGDVT